MPIYAVPVIETIEAAAVYFVLADDQQQAIEKALAGDTEWEQHDKQARAVVDRSVLENKIKVERAW